MSVEITNKRVICEILEDMRNCDKYKNYNQLAFLIEEVQFAANRMESALEDYSFRSPQEQVMRLEKRKRELRREIGRLREEVANLQLAKDELDPEEEGDDDGCEA